MSWFFTPYPFVLYDPMQQNRPSVAIDITRRFALANIVRNATTIMYDYEIQDHDRPDAMADRYYQNPRLDWLFFVVNLIYDPYYQWPLNYAQFSEYMRQKYGSLSVAMNTIHHYEQIVTKRKEYYSNYDGTSITIPESTLIVDETTYLSLNIADRKSVTVYENEENENNRRRNIKILDKKFVPALLRDFRRVFET